MSSSCFSSSLIGGKASLFTSATNHVRRQSEWFWLSTDPGGGSKSILFYFFSVFAFKTKKLIQTRKSRRQKHKKLCFRKKQKKKPQHALEETRIRTAIEALQLRKGVDSCRVTSAQNLPCVAKFNARHAGNPTLARSDRLQRSTCPFLKLPPSLLLERS